MDTFRTSDGCDIAFKLRPADQSGAPRLALVHPLGLDKTIWNRVAQGLAGRAEVLTYDCRGHGRSSRKATAYTIDLFARDLAELLEHLGWQAATVAGCSMGGCVAQAFAGRYPSLLNGLALIDTTAWYGPDGPRAWHDRVAAAHAQGLAGMIEFQSKRWFSDAFRQRHPEIVSAIGDIFMSNDVDCYAATCLMLGDTDLRPLQSSLRVAVAVVVGEEDYATPVTMARQMHEAIPGSTLKILSSVRHLAPVEAPEQITLQLLALLDRVQSTQTAG